MSLPRTLSAHVQAASALFPVLLVVGARQVGKTTLLRTLSEAGRQYVTLDDPLALSLAREEPALFLQRFAPPVLIDEIQYAPGLLPYIKMAADQAQRPGLFWLTGSQPFHLMRGVSESLAGRVAVIRLLGLSHRETLGKGNEPIPPFAHSRPAGGAANDRSPAGGWGTVYRDLAWFLPGYRRQPAHGP